MAGEGRDGCESRMLHVRNLPPARGLRNGFRRQGQLRPGGRQSRP